MNGKEKYVSDYIDRQNCGPAVHHLRELEHHYPKLKGYVDVSCDSFHDKQLLQAGLVLHRCPTSRISTIAECITRKWTLDSPEATDSMPRGGHSNKLHDTSVYFCKLHSTISVGGHRLRKLVSTLIGSERVYEVVSEVLHN